MKTTALFENHKKLGARIIDFGQWQMPVMYNSIIEEHQHVRSECGIFDVSHMGEIFLEGQQAADFAQHLLINDIKRLTPGSGQYTAMLNEKGGFVDDLIIYQLNPEKFLLCVNASNIEKDFQWIKSQSKNFSCQVTDQSANYSQIAVQGPKSVQAIEEIFDRATFERIKKMSYMNIESLNFEGNPVLIARTGYTGEHGYELYLPHEVASSLWNKFLSCQKVSVKPIGLGARDTLRLEAGYLLYGNDMDEQVTPLEAGISWAVRFNKDFIGKEALVNQKELGNHLITVAFQLKEKGIPRSHMKMFMGDTEIGTITSGSFLPTLDAGGGLAIVSPKVAIGDEVEVDIRGKRKLAIIMKRPLYSAKVK